MSWLSQVKIATSMKITNCVIVILFAVGLYLGMSKINHKITMKPLDKYSTNSIRHTDTEQTNKTGIWDRYHGNHWRRDSINENCTKEYKNSHYILIDFLRGRTGNHLFQLYCALVTALRMCYSVAIDPYNKYYVRGILPYFDLSDDFKIMKLNNKTFLSFKGVPDPLSGNKKFLRNSGYNLTLDSRCRKFTYTVGYKDFIRSSIRFKEDIKRNISEYLGHYFTRRSLVAIHVRRTDRVGLYEERGYKYANLEWYKPYINRAMDYLQSKYTNLSFLFISDDKKWCRENFHGDNIYVSPFKSPGTDLALMTRCDHVILTMGTFGWHGAWLGRAKTVIYNSKCVYTSFTKGKFYLPQWTDLGSNSAECSVSPEDA